MSTPLHKRSEKIGVRKESAGVVQLYPGGRVSRSSLLFTHSSPALYLVAALVVILGVACSSEPAPEPTPVPTATTVALVAPTAVPAAPSTEQPPDRSMSLNFSLPSAGGNDISLSGLLEDHRAVVMVFYRGYF